MLVRFLQPISSAEGWSYGGGDVVELPEHLHGFADGVRAEEISRESLTSGVLVHPGAESATAEPRENTAVGGRGRNRTSA